MMQPAFETFLNRLDPALREHQLAFFRIMAAAGPDGVEELAGRVHRISCLAGLKQLTLEFSYYFPWPEWSPVIDRLVRYEKDLERFETGVRALGRIRTPESLDVLRGLSRSRATPGFREVVEQVLQETDPAEAFHHHFFRLLQGSANPGEADESAEQLSRLLGPESLEPLKDGVNHPDPLVFRHALRLICQIPSKEVALYLQGYLDEIQQDAAEDHEARILLAAFRTLPRPEVQEQAIQALSARWKEQQPEAVAELTSGQADRVWVAVAALREVGTAILDALLLDTLLAAMEENPAHLAEVLTQAGDAVDQRTRRLDFALQTAAQGLVDLADQGLIEAADPAPDQLVHPAAR